MRSIGLPELIVILIVMLGIPVVAFVAIIRAVRSSGSRVSSRFCTHCGQRVPDIGRFCPLCGQPVQ